MSNSKIKTITAKVSPIGESTKKLKSGMVALDSNSKYKLPENICTVQSVIPPQVSAILKSQFASVGINFDLNGLVLAKDNKQSIKQLVETIDLIKDSQSLLPQLKSAILSGIKAASKQSQFNRDIALQCLESQADIDRNQADVLLALAGYANKKTNTELRLEYGIKRLEARAIASAKRHELTFGKEAEFIDASYVSLAEIAIKNMDVAKIKNQIRNDKTMKRAEASIL